MKDFKDFELFLTGKKFSDQLVFENLVKYPIIGRGAFLLNLLKNKKIIHMGCVDHLELIEDRIKQGDWLHQKITDVAKRNIGIDTNCEGIKLLKEKIGIQDVHCIDIKKDSLHELENETFDFILLGEVLEHIDNPVEFLSTIKNRFRNIKRIIITVPHVLNRDRFIDAQMGKEIINSDHRFWFTGYTLLKILTQSEIKVDEINYSNLVNLTLQERIIFKVRQTFKKNHAYPFFYYKNLIAIGTLNSL